MKNKFIEIKTTYKSLILAKRICQKLLENKLVACAQISKIQSFYIFDNKPEIQNEILVVLKTKKSLYHKIKKQSFRDTNIKCHNLYPKILMTVPILI